MEKKFKLGLVPRLIIGILLGIFFGQQFIPEVISRLIVTLSGIFSSYLSFVIPLMILAYVTMGIAGLREGSGFLLAVTCALAYASTLISGTASFTVAYNLFPSFMNSEDIQKIAETAGKSLEPFLSLKFPPILDTLSAVLFAFILGLGISTLRASENKMGDYLYNSFGELSNIIDRTLRISIIPFLPLYICGTFVNMTKSGQTFVILGILWKVFLVVILMHFIYLVIVFFVAGAIGKKSPIFLIKNQIRGYITALGTQSSAATIPVNLQCAEKDGISEQIRNFVVPLCANIHMAGSMITITACATAVCLMNQIPISYTIVLPFILILGIAMVASPGAPGGSIMTALPALPFLYMVGLGAPDSPLCAIMVALYITQDSFGTACNVSGDNALGVIVDTIYKKKVVKTDA